MLYSQKLASWKCGCGELSSFLSMSNIFSAFSFCGFLSVMLRKGHEWRHYFLCTRFSPNWQGHIKTHLIWWSVTEDSLMHLWEWIQQWPSIAFFSFFETALICQVLFLPSDLIQIQGCRTTWRKRVLKQQGSKSYYYFVLLCFCGWNLFTDLHCIFLHFSSEACWRPLRALWFYLHGSLIIESSYAVWPAKKSDEKFLWK